MDEIAENEFDQVRCRSLDGLETEFYHWALNLKKEPWTVRPDEYMGDKYLFFKCSQPEFEISVKVDLETGYYKVCNLYPLGSHGFTPREYNEHLDMFVKEILDQFNLDNGNHLYIEHVKCGGTLTYDCPLDMRAMWGSQPREDFIGNVIRELYLARLDLMTDVVNRYAHELISMKMHSVISNHIVEIINEQLLMPGDCDLLMAAQCFTGMCLTKMATAASRINMFDDFLTVEYRSHLSKLVGIDASFVEDSIQLGTVRLNLSVLYNKETVNGTEN